MPSESHVYQPEAPPIGKPSLLNLMFTSTGRIGRGRFWFGAVMVVAFSMIVTVVMFGMAKVTGTTADDGSFNVSGLAALPFIALGIAELVVTVWAGICLGMKRYHDRNKSGAWILVQLIPVIGALWYFIEAGCLRGTVGMNEYGPDPVM